MFKYPLLSSKEQHFMVMMENITLQGNIAKITEIAFLKHVQEYNKVTLQGRTVTPNLPNSLIRLTLKNRMTSLEATPLACNHYSVLSLSLKSQPMEEILIVKCNLYIGFLVLFSCSHFSFSQPSYLETSFPTVVAGTKSARVHQS